MERKVQQQKKDFFSLARNKGRPNLTDDDMLQKIRDVIIASRLAGTVISQKMVIANGPGVIKANEPKTRRKIF